MTRRLLNLVPALSLLLGVAVLALWAFNRRSIHGATLGSASGFGLVFCRPAGLYLAVGRYLRPPQPNDPEPWMRERAWGVRWTADVITRPDNALRHTTLGVGAGTFDAGPGSTPHSRIRFLLVPYWLLAAGAAAPVAAWAARRRRGAAAAAGLCPSCGYDLRASADRCPECGTPMRTPA